MRDDLDTHNMILSRTKSAAMQLSVFPSLMVNDLSPSIRSIDVPNEHAAIKLHIRRVCSPPPLIRAPAETRPIHSTTNLFFPSRQEHLSSSMKITPRQWTYSNTDLQQNDSLNHFTTFNVPRRMTATRRLSLAESDQSSRAAFIDHPRHIPDENTFKRASIRSIGNKRQKVTTKTVKSTTSSSSMSCFDNREITRCLSF